MTSAPWVRVPATPPVPSATMTSAPWVRVPATPPVPSSAPPPGAPVTGALAQSPISQRALVPVPGGALGPVPGAAAITSADAGTSHVVSPVAGFPAAHAATHCRGGPAQASPLCSVTSQAMCDGSRRAGNTQ
eukprot:6394764-Prymnesium_polylepis.1